MDTYINMRVTTSHPLGNTSKIRASWTCVAAQKSEQAPPFCFVFACCVASESFVCDHFGQCMSPEFTSGDQMGTRWY